MDDKKLIEIAKRVLSIEAHALTRLEQSINLEFVKAVNCLFDCNGKVIVIGMGKSGLVAKKIAATLASTGTPGFFLHPAEGVHGDLGMIAREDVCLLISYSGETRETLDILPNIRRLGAPIIVMAGVRQSTLGRVADIFLDIAVTEEACPLGLAPTASTTVTMALGDALAVALLEKRGFTQEEFAIYHPSGSLGKKLLLRVSDVMHAGDKHPQVSMTATMAEAIILISEKRLGVAAVVNKNGKLMGVITDGDLRRGLLKYRERALLMSAADFMTKDPKRIHKDALAMKALHMMDKFSISNIFVTEKDDPDVAIATLHVHDLLKAGLV